MRAAGAAAAEFVLPLRRGIWHNGILRAELAPAPTGHHMSKPKLLIVEDDIAGEVTKALGASTEFKAP